MVLIKDNAQVCCCPGSYDTLNRVGRYICPGKPGTRGGPFADSFDRLDELLLLDSIQSNYPFCPTMEETEDKMMCSRASTAGFSMDAYSEKTGNFKQGQHRFYTSECEKLEIVDGNNTLWTAESVGLYKSSGEAQTRTGGANDWACLRMCAPLASDLVPIFLCYHSLRDTRIPSPAPLTLNVSDLDNESPFSGYSDRCPYFDSCGLLPSGKKICDFSDGASNNDAEYSFSGFIGRVVELPVNMADPDGIYKVTFNDGRTSYPFTLAHLEMQVRRHTRAPMATHARADGDTHTHTDCAPRTRTRPSHAALAARFKPPNILPLF